MTEEEEYSFRSGFRSSLLAVCPWASDPASLSHQLRDADYSTCFLGLF